MNTTRSEDGIFVTNFFEREGSIEDENEEWKSGWIRILVAFFSQRQAENVAMNEIPPLSLSLSVSQSGTRILLRAIEHRPRTRVLISI